ncbi:helix-turn-helix domain-containing protein [Frankia sp. R82]|uniref:MmyB family transcriptional regulator n=1 Tax=Frankia sp. R82 TaxID=2950553 RepID=UPI002044081F|nr:helix-turn-helix domain-containing protein [Frankia sp. R82]MCM3885499.1 helix-turn-helix domain-containing protein [Frankia sp. R82]
MYWQVLDGNRGGGQTGHMAAVSTTLGEFLALRRAKLDPRVFGIGIDRRRRVTGLRREEVAALVGVSAEYYARLERGKASRPSPQVLEAIAEAFSMTSTERSHLFDLAHGLGRARRADVALARPALAGLVAGLGIPALVINHRFDVITSNQLAQRLFFDFDATHEGNLARFLFLDPLSHRLYRDWRQIARATAAQLRVASARHRHDSRLARLIGELMLRGDHFVDLWAAGEVMERSHGVKRFWNAEVGNLDLAYENLDLPGDRPLRLVLFHAAPQSADHDKLRLLGARPAAALDVRVQGCPTGSSSSVLTTTSPGAGQPRT